MALLLVALFCLASRMKMSWESMKRPLALPLGRLTMVLMMSPGKVMVVVRVELAGGSVVGC